MSAFFRRKKPGKASGASPETPPPPPAPAGMGDMGQTTYITGDRQRDTDRVRLLIDSLREVTSAAHHEGLLESMVDRAVRTVGAERGMLFAQDDAGVPVMRVARSSDETDLPPGVRFSTQVVESVLGGGPSVCRRDDDDADFDPSQSMISLDIRGVMCVPLTSRDKRIGVIYVDARASERQFTKSDLRFFEAFADMLGIIWHNRELVEERLRSERMSRDLELVRTIQGNLLPTHPLRETGFAMCGTVIPADEAGGDYFDFFKTTDGRIAMAVGDVSGHGAGPALFMSGARAYMRAYAQNLTSPRDMLNALNDHLVGDMGDDMFMSMFYCVLDPVTREFHYANAGHPPPVLVHQESGQLENYKLTGMALGVADDADWSERGPFELVPGDTVVMFTDGIIEMRRDGEQFSRERLVESITRHRDGTIEELRDGIINDVLVWAGDDASQDDVTVAILRVKA